VILDFWRKHRRRAIWLVTTMQEAFSAIIPYFLLLSLLTLIDALLHTAGAWWFHISVESIEELTYALSLFSSLVIVIAVSYAFGRRFEVSTIMAIMLGIASYVTSLILEGAGTVLLVSEGSYGFAFQPLVVPILSTWMLHLTYPRFSLKIPLYDANAHIYRLFNYLLAFMLAYGCTLFFYLLIDYVVDYGVDVLFEDIELTLSPIVALLLRDFGVEFFWFLGLHGDYTMNALFGKELLSHNIVEGLSIGEFNRMFVSLGGSGAGVALLIALLRYAKDEMIRFITKISIPLVLFNINTLLIYAVVVFNRFLFVPFLLVPLLNIMIAYLFLLLVPVGFTTADVVWTTPIFLDSMIKSNEPLLLVGLQVFLVVVDTLIYGYFVRRFVQSQSNMTHLKRMHTNLNVPYTIRATQHIESYVAHQEIILSNAQLESLIDQLNAKNLLLYYQPKIAVEAYGCNDFEALLRYQEGDRIRGPFFLDIVEKAGMAHVIDLWVAERIQKDLKVWEEEAFFPVINMNLHPDTLAHSESIARIIALLKGYAVRFEIVERSFLAGEKAQESVRALKEAGFEISIDDYGVGYSNIETLVRYPISELKIDRGILLLTKQEEGKKAYKHIVNLGKEMGFKVVAEGAESQEEVEWLGEIGVDYIQGFYFCCAIPFEEVYPFVKQFERAT